MIFIVNYWDQAGKQRVREVTAVDESEARRKLRRMGISPRDATFTIKPELPEQDFQELQDPYGSREAEEEKLMIEWARSMGYPVPEPRIDGCKAWLTVLAGFLICFIPGVLAFIYVAQRNGAYIREMASLRTKWVDAGKPNPGEKGILPGKLEVLPETSEDKTIDQKLDEIKSLRDDGQITEDEYQAMRRKVLGL